MIDPQTASKLQSLINESLFSALKREGFIPLSTTKMDFVNQNADALVELMNRLAEKL